MNYHNESNTRLYRIWHNIRQKCLNSYSMHYRKFNTFYKPWDSYKVFKEWAINNGYDDTMCMKRIVTKNGFNPSNCIWIFDIHKRKRNRNDL